MKCSKSKKRRGKQDQLVYGRFRWMVTSRRPIRAKLGLAPFIQPVTGVAVADEMPEENSSRRGRNCRRNTWIHCTLKSIFNAVEDESTFGSFLIVPLIYQMWEAGTECRWHRCSAKAAAIIFEPRSPNLLQTLLWYIPVQALEPSLPVFGPNSRRFWLYEQPRAYLDQGGALRAQSDQGAALECSWSGSRAIWEHTLITQDSGFGAILGEKQLIISHMTLQYVENIRRG